MKTHPFTGKPYPAGYFTPATVAILLSLASIEVPEATIQAWTDQQRHDAGDWAIRTHARASDNLNQVPPKPAFLPKERGVNPAARNVMEI